jgi:hypothetical protein
VVLLVVVVVAGGIALDAMRKARAAREAGGETPAASTPEAKSSPGEASKASEQTPPRPPTPSPKTATGIKSIGDLKVGETISVEEPKGAKGSRLVYATGAVKNESDVQRFGVRVDLDLFDSAGAKVGTATDYTQSIEPRATWRFRALVVERRAMSAKLAKITEDN